MRNKCKNDVKYKYLKPTILRLTLTNIPNLDEIFFWFADFTVRKMYVYD